MGDAMDSLAAPDPEATPPEEAFAVASAVLLASALISTSFPAITGEVLLRYAFVVPLAVASAKVTAAPAPP